MAPRLITLLGFIKIDLSYEIQHYLAMSKYNHHGPSYGVCNEDPVNPYDVELNTEFCCDQEDGRASEIFTEGTYPNVISLEVHSLKFFKGVNVKEVFPDLIAVKVKTYMAEDPICGLKYLQVEECLGNCFFSVNTDNLVIDSIISSEFILTAGSNTSICNDDSAVRVHIKLVGNYEKVSLNGKFTVVDSDLFSADSLCAMNGVELDSVIGKFKQLETKNIKFSKALLNWLSDMENFQPFIKTHHGRAFQDVIDQITPHMSFHKDALFGLGHHLLIMSQLMRQVG